MSKLRIILRLYTQGVSKSSISEKTGIARNTVKKYIRDFIALGEPLETINALSDKDLELLFMHEEHKRPNSRYHEALAFFPKMEKALKTKGMIREKQWIVYKELHPAGFGRSHFQTLYNRWQNKPKSTMHIDHKAGDKMYIDYAGSKLEYIDQTTGEICPVEVFVAILGASQLTYVEASMTQQKEDLVTACENALHYFGGSPQAVVTDNLKSAVIRSDKYEPRLNEMFKDFAEHYGMTVLPARPYRPTYKALVEGMVKIIYRTIYIYVNGKKHFSLDELNLSIREDLEALNNQFFSNRPYSRRQLFEETEKNVLQALPVCRYESRRKQVVQVQKNNHVRLGEDIHYYSVPFEYISQSATILYSQTKVDIYIGYVLVASHNRDRRPYCYTTVADHMASKHQYASDWTPEKFIERASCVGESTRDYIIRILELKQHPEQAYKSCQGILSFASKAGHERLENACVRAIYYREYSYKVIQNIIEKGLDKSLIDKESEQKIIPLHENIRGNKYYK